MNSKTESQLGSKSISISDNEFNLFRSFIYDNFGINLTEVKRALLVNRLQKILRQGNFKSFEEYYNSIKKDQTGASVSELINAVSTNHTFFFRESIHFDYLVNKALPEIVNELRTKNNKDLRIWCAAASSGEEPYVLAMLIKDYLGSEYNQWSAGVLATDISVEALNIAVQGVYTAERIQQVPAKYKTGYFEKIDSDSYQIKESLKKELVFRRFNLMNEKLPFKKPFHVIFCRNVMIYFDQKTRDSLVNRLFDYTYPGGYLFIGNAETLGRTNCPYKYIAPSIYQKI